MRLSKEVNDPPQVVAIVGRPSVVVGGGRQDLQAAAVRRQELADALTAGTVTLPQQAGDRLGRRQIEHGSDVAKMRVGIQDGNPLAGLPLQREGEVDGDHRLADSALGPGHRDHRAAPVTGRELASAAHLADLLLDEHGIHRLQQARRLDGLDDVVAGAEDHAPADGLGVIDGGVDDDRGVR